MNVIDLVLDLTVRDLLRMIRPFIELGKPAPLEGRVREEKEEKEPTTRIEVSE